MVVGSGSFLIEAAHKPRPAFKLCAWTEYPKENYPPCSCRLTLIVFQQAAQPFPTAHWFLLSRSCWSLQGEQQEVVFALVISFLMIVDLVVA